MYLNNRIKVAKIGYIMISILLCVLGIVLIAVPDFSVTLLCRLGGVIMVLFGLVKIVGYCSKDSFLNRDAIPSRREKNQKYSFSGKRIKRGLYREADGREINADLNGSANILRKAFPHAFREDPDFNNIWVIRHPDPVLA